MTRPTTDRTREAIFNALASLGVIEGAVVLDLFAGTGALGIEALSRGAESCLFVESDRQAVESIRQNLRALGLEDRGDVVAGRVETVIASRTSTTFPMLGRANLAFADPPYGYHGWEELAGQLGSILAERAIVVVESGNELERLFAESSVWTVIRSKRYGRTWVTFLERTEAFTD